MLTIDPLTRPDVESALRLSTQAGWNQTAADWHRLLDLWPASCLAGRVGGRLVATATLAAYPGASPGRGRLGWVGMVLVDEAYRGRGYGTAILDASLDLGRGAGVPVVGLDATHLGRPLYVQRGLVDAAGIERWSIQRTPQSAPPRAPSLTRALTEADWPSLLMLDRTATGVDREPLLRHLVGEPGVRACVHSPLGEPVEAFALLRPGRVAAHVGPVVATGRVAAEAVIDALLAELPQEPPPPEYTDQEQALHSLRQPGRPLQTSASSVEPRLQTEDEGTAIHHRPLQSVFIDVPSNRMDDWLTARGWVVARRLTRMQTAPPEPTGEGIALAGNGVFAAAGFELG